MKRKTQDDEEGDSLADILANVGRLSREMTKELGRAEQIARAAEGSPAERLAHEPAPHENEENAG